MYELWLLKKEYSIADIDEDTLSAVRADEDIFAVLEYWECYETFETLEEAYSAAERYVGDYPIVNEGGTERLHDFSAAF